jgi:hypothetical protein
MNFTALAVSYLLAALLVYAWFREHRLRRALQTILNKIFTFRSNQHDSPYSSSARSATGPLRRTVDHRRMR